MNGRRSLVIASLVQAFTSVVLAGITGYYVYLMQNMLKAQVEPVIDLELNGSGLVIGNSGAYPVVDVSVNADSTSFVGPPWNRPAMQVTQGPRIPGRPPTGWWRLDRLGPGEVQIHPLSDVAENALQGTDWMEKAKKEGHLSGIPPHDRAQLFTFIFFRLTFHRDFDHKLYTIQRTAYVARDSKSGKPIVWDARALPLMRQMLEKLWGNP